MAKKAAKPGAGKAAQPKVTKGIEAGAIRFDVHGRILVDEKVLADAQMANVNWPPWLGGGGGGASLNPACPNLACVPEVTCADAGCVPEAICTDVGCVPQGICADAACVPESICPDVACVPESICTDVACMPESICTDAHCEGSDSLCADVFCKQNEACNNGGCEINLECGGGGPSTPPTTESQ